MDRFFSSIFFLLLTITLYGQVSYPRGLNPPKVKWNQIETDKVQIIFPTETEPQAQRAANLIHMLYDSSYYALGPKREKVSIIIQNQTTLSNGFVTVGPFRSEFFTTPPQFNFGGSVSWMDMLTIHEYRHVEQYANAKKGITKIGSILYGENGWGGAAGLALPRWFWEGDAVFAETALTPAGRGRLPDFDKEYRSLLLSGKRYGYEKAAATSLKDFVPNHYNLGYYLTTQLRLDHGNDVWRDVMADAVDYKGVFFPFSQGIKKKSGGKTKVLYARTMDRLTTEWETEKEQLDLTTHTQLTPAKKVFTDIKNPTYTRDGTLIYEKRGFNTISTFHELRDGKERKLLSPGFFSIDNATISVSNSKMVWSELRNDERWGNQNFSVIMSFDLDQKSKKRLTSQTKYFSPALSPEGNRIIAVHSPENAKYALHLLDSNGKLLDVLPNPEQVFYAFPRWIDNSNIVAMVRKNNQSALYLINTQTKTQRPISAFYDHQLAYPTTHDGITYFTSTFTGIDNIFALDQSTGIIYQVTSSLLGATQPNVSPDGKTLVFSEFSPMGFDVKSIAIDQTQWKRLKDQYPTAIDFYSPLLTETGNILNQVPEKQFAVTKYNKLSELIRIHSWIPWAAPPNLGLQIFGANKLTTLSAAGSIRYNANESTTSYGVSLSYGDLYTPIEAGYTRSNRSRNVPVYNERIRAGDTTISVQSRRREWVEHDASVGLVLPLNFLNGNHFTKLWLTGKYHLLDVDFDGDLTPDETFGALDLELDFFNLRRTARQQIAPRWGQSVTLNYNQTVGAEASETSTLTLGSRWYFPGLFRNHSFNIRADFQVESFTDSYKFRDNFFYARGYGSVLHDRIWKVGVNYALPLFYPDIALGPLAFIKRVKVNFFYDHSESTTDDIPINELAPISDVSFTGSFNGSTRTFRSVGAELTFDTRLFRLLEVDMGVRYSYLLDDVGLEKHQFNFIVFSIAF